MSTIVAIFEGERGADAARDILRDAGYTTVVLKSPHDPYDAPVEFRHRGELMLRAAVKWGLIASLAIEIPSLIVLLMLPIDLNVKVLMGSMVWKFGAGFGAWLGAASAAERGLDTERAEDYQRELAKGRRLLTVDVASSDRPSARGALLESGAIEVRDLTGTFETVH